MKICYIGDSDSILVKRWIRYFVNKDYDIHIITDGKSGIKKVTKHEFNFRLRGSPLNLFHKFNFFKKTIKNINPNIIHAHFCDPYAFWGSFLGFHPFVITTWGSDILINPNKSLKLRLMTRFSLRKSDLVTSDSKFLKKETVKMGADPERTHYILWGVDFDMFKSKIDGKIIKEKLGLENYPVIISNRNFKSLYNIDIIIKAFAKVLVKIPDAKLILIWASGNEYKNLRDLTKKLKIENNVIFEGSIEHKMMPFYLKASDIFVSVPSSDSTPISLLEAMACGVPPIVSQLPANEEFIKNDWNGYLVSDKDFGALATSMIDLLENKTKQKLFKIRNLRIVKYKCDYKVHLDRMETLYKSLL